MPKGSTPRRLSRRINSCEVFHKVSSASLGSAAGRLRLREFGLQEITEVLGEPTCQDVGVFEGKRRSRERRRVGPGTQQEGIIGLLDVLEPMLVMEVVQVTKHGPHEIMLG